MDKCTLQLGEVNLEGLLGDLDQVPDKADVKLWS